MTARWLIVAAALTFCVHEASAEDKTPKGKPKAAAAQPAVRPDAIPGYTIQTIEGFTVVLSDETMKNQQSSKDERKPLEVLDFELKTISKFLSPAAVHALRDLLIWVEWDEREAMSNGRQGSAEAVYYGGHQLQLLAQGKHPLKARNITILSMKTLTREHQPKYDSGRCVILHEMTHAVHDQFLGDDNPNVMAAYRQAMERKLYDPQMYASTNEHEFFAETTCAYFDQLHYYPRTRADLQKHDPITYQLLEGIWGKRQDAGTEKKTGPEGSAELAFKLDKIPLGKPVLGRTVTAADLEGHTALVVYWNAANASSLSAFQKLNAWDTELSDFGFTTVAVHLTGSESQDVRGAAESRHATIPVTEGRWNADTIVKEFNDFPRCLLFDPQGKCVFHGGPFDAEETIRKTIGNALVDGCGVATFPKPMTAQVDALRGGKLPSSLLTQLMGHTRSSDDETSEAAKKLVAAVTAGGEKLLEAAEPMAKDDPVGAYLKVERLPLVYKGTPLAASATKLLGKLKRDKGVMTELRARPTLVMVRNLDAELSSRPGGFDPTQLEFQRENRPLLEQMQQAVVVMKKSWPDARATQEAVETGTRYGVKVP